MSPGPVYATASLPAPIIGTEKPLLVVFEAAAAAQWLSVVENAGAIAITDKASMQAAEKALLAIHDAEKLIEARRVELKKPITQMGKAIEEVVAKVADPVATAKRALQGKIAAYVTAEKRAAAEAQRLADEQLAKDRAAAEVERKRLQAEADAKHAAEVAEAKRQAAADAAELAALLGEDVQPEAVTVAPAPVIAAPEIPVRTATLMPPVESSAVTMRKETVLVIDDESLIPHHIGTRILMIPDRAEIKAVLGLGIAVPGCHLETVERPVMARQK